MIIIYGKPSAMKVFLFSALLVHISTDTITYRNVLTFNAPEHLLFMLPVITIFVLLNN